MKILVTGGAGFIGSAFVKLLISNQLKPIIIDKLTYAGDIKRISKYSDNYVFYQVDIANKLEIEKIFELEHPDIVVHFAAETHVDKSIYDSTPFLITNVIGTQNLLDLSLKYNIKKFVNISTDEVYGELGIEGQFYENTPLNPNSPYSVSKTSQDMLGRAYYKTFGLPIITCRPSNNYGPWQYPEKFLPVIIYKALKNQKIPVYGDGQNIREWLYVGDNCKAIFKVVTDGKIGEIYNIGSGNEKTNIDLVKFVLKYLNKSEELIEFVKDRPGHDFRYSVNYVKIKNELGWQPEIDFESGIMKTVNWYVDNLEWVESKIEELKELWDLVYKK